MLKYNLSTLNNPYDLFCRYCKKVLNFGDLGIKLRYYLEKRVFMKNKNILLISYKILYNSKREVFQSQYGI